MSQATKKWQAAALLDLLPGTGSGKERYLEPFESGDVSLGIYAPRGVDQQEPHDKDEFYFVISGRGQFVHGDERSPFAPGDALFVPAGEVHRFEDFSDDFSAWVVFWQPRDDHA
jgi:mannose-6-phosphate isomerase-like protein (cupin superfamily)